MDIEGFPFAHKVKVKSLVYHTTFFVIRLLLSLHPHSPYSWAPTLDFDILMTNSFTHPILNRTFSVPTTVVLCTGTFMCAVFFSYNLPLNLSSLYTFLLSWANYQSWDSGIEEQARRKIREDQQGGWSLGFRAALRSLNLTIKMGRGGPKIAALFIFCSHLISIFPCIILDICLLQSLRW